MSVVDGDERERPSPEPEPRPRWRHWLHLFWYGISTPIRLFRQRTSIQLVVSYVAAVLLAIILIQATIVSTLFWERAAQI
ncbi:MAG: hypothetical protein WBA46_16910, partial [Thermomicrobiales bacterium]